VLVTHSVRRTVVVSLAERAGPHLTGPDQRARLDELSQEHDNLRAALQMGARPRRGRTGAANGRIHLEILVCPWTPSGRPPLARGRARPPIQPLTDHASGLGPHCPRRGRILTGRPRHSTFRAYQEALDIHQALGDQAATVGALLDLGETQAVSGNPEVGVEFVEESLALVRELRDCPGEAWGLWGLATMRMFAGDLDAARDLLEESLRIFQEVMDDTWGWGNALSGLGGLAAQRATRIRRRPRSSSCRGGVRWSAHRRHA
jgi:hypothetical protein